MPSAIGVVPYSVDVLDLADGRLRCVADPRLDVPSANQCSERRAERTVIVPTSSTTSSTSSTLRPAACTPRTCDDGDPCTEDACRNDSCVHRGLTGLAGARCVCEGPLPAACRERRVPRAVGRRVATACRLLERAERARAPGRARQLVVRATRSWRKAGRIASVRRLRRPRSAACNSALEAMARSGQLRAGRLLTDR